ncbi:MAG: exosortase-associated EpsI family protein [bacterium]|nr:exosortase-associated EpsI family protein [bacterium]
MNDGEERTGLFAMLRMPFFWLSLVAIGLVSFLYYPLFFPPSAQQLTVKSEEFFFEANEAAGVPVLVLSFWLLYRRSHYRDLLMGRGEPALALPLLALSAALYGWGHYTGSPDLQLASLIGILAGFFSLLGGRAALRAYWLPILFLGFALPLPPVLLSAVIFPIQLATAEYAGLILNALSVESLVQGDQILRPENTFIVIETCSGVRTIVTLTMLTVLLIDLFERRGWHALTLVILAPIVAFLSNGFRVVTLVLNPHSSIHSIHNLQGILMLLVGLSMIYGLDLLLERVFGTSAPSPSQAGYGRTHASIADDRSRIWRMSSFAAVLLVMLGIGRVMTPWPIPSGLDEMPDDLLVRVFGERTKRIEPDFQFRGSVRYLAHADRQTRIAGEPVEVFLGIGNEQIRKHTLLTSRLAWPESGFVAIEESFVQLSEQGDGPEVRRMILRRGARSVLSYSWYERAGDLSAEWLRQAAALDRSPFVRSEHMLAIRISTPIDRGRASIERAEERIRVARARLAPALEGYAPTAPIHVQAASQRSRRGHPL